MVDSNNGHNVTSNFYIQFLNRDQLLYFLSILIDRKEELIPRSSLRCVSVPPKVEAQSK